METARIKSPAVSVVMPLFNKEKEVGRALRSVQTQTIGDWEMIVVNDGSTDRGPEIVQRIADGRLTLLHQLNAGVSSARNRGIQESRSELIAFLDADDEWAPDFLETILRLREKYFSCDVFATGYFFCRENCAPINNVLRGLPEGFGEGILTDYFGVAARSDPPLWSSAVAVTKRAIDAVGGFPVGVTAGEDLLTWARLAVRYKIAYGTKPSAFFWSPERLSDRPGRLPQQPDVVGMELKKLTSEILPDQYDSFLLYRGLWHRMRANIFIRAGEKNKARMELNISRKISGWNLRLMALAVIAYIPGNANKYLFSLLRKFYRKCIYGIQE